MQPGDICHAKSCNCWVMKLYHNIFTYISMVHIKFGDHTIAHVDVACVSSALLTYQRRAEGR